jgi:UDP-N-acetylmuramate dehydrogenase
LLRVESEAQLAAAASALGANTAPIVLGGGSNIVITQDIVHPVLLMAMRGIRLVKETSDAWFVEAAAGEPWHDFVMHCLAQGWHGLENLSLIPGTVGAAPVQNIGAYGVELDTVFHSLRAFDWHNHAFTELTREACQFAYRDSLFKHAGKGRYTITYVTFRLPKHAPVQASYRDVADALRARNISQPTLRDIADCVIAIRQAKLPDPAVIGNAGSFFKNPIVAKRPFEGLLQAHPSIAHYPQDDGSVKLAAAWLIDQAGWKGKTQGCAGVHPKQALVLTNLGGATGQEILALASAIQQDVEAKFGVKLEPEPVIL